jgi:hypothetical protein
MPIIKLPEMITEVEYHRMWNDENSYFMGYMFPCDSDGNIYMDNLAPGAVKNLWKCIAVGYEEHKDEDWRIEGIVRLIDMGIVRNSRTYPQAGIMKCDICDEVFQMLMDGMASCACPGCCVEYDYSGRLFTPRKQWGAETGERF